MFFMPGRSGFYSVPWTGPTAFRSTSVQIAYNNLNYATMPATISAGDLLIHMRYNVSTGSYHTLNVGTGFTSVDSNTYTVSSSGGTLYYRHVLAYKVADGTEDSTNITTWNTNYGSGYAYQLYPGSVVIKPTTGTFATPTSVWGHSNLLDGATLPFGSMTGSAYVAVLVLNSHGIGGTASITGLSADATSSWTPYGTGYNHAAVYSGTLPLSDKVYDYSTIRSSGTDQLTCTIFTW